MEIKKKLKFSLRNYGIVLKMALFFMLVLNLQMICCSTCYATTPTVSELKKFFDFVIEKQQAGELNYTTALSDSETIANTFYTYTQNINYSLDNLIFVSTRAGYNSRRGPLNVKGLVFIANNSFGDNSLSFLHIKGLTNSIYSLYKNTSSNAFIPCFWIFTDGTFAFDNDFESSAYYNSNGNDTLSINFDNSYIVNNYILTTAKTCAFYYYYNNQYYPVLNNYSGFTYNDMYNPTPEPDEPSGDITSGTGTITNNSGDTTGKINLSGIEQGIGNIQNQISGDSQKIINNQNENTQTIVNTISGEFGKITNTLTDNADDTIDNTVITSGDIESSLGFEIAENPYENFWTTLTNNLKNALLGSKRSIDIFFQDRTWTISLDEYLVLPTWLTIILIPISTSFFAWFLVRQWKIIFDKLASGNIDSILKENSEERNI